MVFPAEKVFQPGKLHRHVFVILLSAFVCGKFSCIFKWIITRQRGIFTPSPFRSCSLLVLLGLYYDVGAFVFFTFYDNPVVFDEIKDRFSSKAVLPGINDDVPL